MVYLQVENLTKSFGDRLLFENISFGIDQGQRVALIAQNGTGKTTLLNIVGGLDSYDSGDLVINKCNPKHLLSPLNILKEAGYKLDFKQECLHVYKSVGNQINIKTDVYPGFPTDLQPIFGVLASQAKKVSFIEETIFENRMQIYSDLVVSGVNCLINKNKV